MRSKSVLTASSVSSGPTLRVHRDMLPASPRQLQCLGRSNHSHYRSVLPHNSLLHHAPFYHPHLQQRCRLGLSASMTAPVIASQLSPTAAQFIPASAQVLASSSPQLLSYPQQMPVPASQPTLLPTSHPATCPSYESIGGQPALTSTPALDVNGMHTLINLLDQIMAHQHVQVAAPAPAPSQQLASGPFQGRNCWVCGDISHSTLMHCRKENLCLSCFAPGHWKKDCAKHGQKPKGQAMANQGRPSEN